MTRAEFCAFVRMHDNFVILTHRRPDGDTIGCASALCLGLRQLGKTAFVLKNEQFTPRFQPFLDGLACETLPVDVTVISTDIASEGLLSFDAVRMDLTPVCAVDHHGSNSLACPKLVEADKAACGEIVHAILQELGVTVTKRIAECLYVAVSTDTGCFKYNNTTAETFAATAELLKAGADNKGVNLAFFNKISAAKMKLEGLIYSGIRFFRDGDVAVAVVTKDMIAQCGAGEEDMDDIAGLAARAESAKISITVREKDKRLCRISVRTSDGINASRICEVFGGGGHAAAAGCTIEAEPERAVRMLMEVIDEVCK